MSWRWLALGEDALPAGEQWLSPAEAATLTGLRFTKRRTEYLLRRLVAKHAVAAVTGRPTDPTALAASRFAMLPVAAHTCPSRALRSEWTCRSPTVPVGRFA